MSFNEGETITIHNTDNDTTAKATIVDFKGDFLRVLVDGKVAIFYSSGGNYSSSSGIAELDSQKKPFENWLNFIGLTEFTAIDIAPTMGLPEDVKGVIEKSKDEAKKLAETF